METSCQISNSFIDIIIVKQCANAKAHTPSTGISARKIVNRRYLPSDRKRLRRISFNNFENQTTLVKIFLKIVSLSAVFASLSGCNYFAESTIRTLIPKFFVIQENTFFNSSHDCMLSVYKISGFTYHQQIKSNFRKFDYRNKSYRSENELIGVTLLSGYSCASKEIKYEFARIHESEDTIFFHNISQNAVLAYHPATQTLYFSGRD